MFANQQQEISVEVEHSGHITSGCHNQLDTFNNAPHENQGTKPSAFQLVSEIMRRDRPWATDTVTTTAVELRYRLTRHGTARSGKLTS